MIVLLETEPHRSLAPITRLRLFSEVPVAGLSNIDRVRVFLGEEPVAYVNGIRRRVAESEGIEVIENVDEPSILVSSRLIITPDLSARILRHREPGILYTDGEEPLFGYIRDGSISEFLLKAKRRLFRGGVVVKTFWDLVEVNRSGLFRATLELLSSRYDLARPGVYYGSDVGVEDGVVFNTASGPVIIDNGAYIQGPSRIEGPTYVGPGSVVAACANIRRSYIGPKSTVGGELNRSVVFRYSNARHQGYIGDSYLGEFVNVGALTVTSNLKNTFGPMKFRYPDGSFDETGLRKVGVILADHSKTSVGTTIYGGVSIDAFSHVHFKLTRSLPPFVVWYGDTAYELKLDSAIRTARKLAESKGVELSHEYLEAVKNLFTETSEERANFGVVRGRIGGKA